MRFRVTSLVVASILASTVSVTAHAQQTPAACPSSTAQELATQIKALDNGQGPNVQSFTCEVRSNVMPGVMNYVFRNDSTKQLASVIFEVKKNGQSALLAALYANGKCPATRCIRGWLNNAFLDTGYADPTGTWTVIQEDDPDATLLKTFTESKRGLVQRAP